MEDIHSSRRKRTRKLSESVGVFAERALAERAFACHREDSDGDDDEAPRERTTALRTGREQAIQRNERNSSESSDNNETKRTKKETINPGEGHGSYTVPRPERADQKQTRLWGDGATQMRRGTITGRR